jgi:hypothetical protein
MAAESGDLLGRCRAEMAIGRAHAARGAHASAQAALEAARAALMKSSQLGGAMVRAPKNIFPTCFARFLRRHALL